MRGFSLLGTALLTVVIAFASATALGDSEPGLREHLSLLRSPDPAKRVEGLRGMLALDRVELQGLSRRTFKPLLKLVRKDADPLVRGLAARALARTDGALAGPALVEVMATERHPDVERALLRAVGDLPAGEALAVVSKAAFDDSDLRRSALAAEALGWVADDAGTSDLLGLLSVARGWPTIAGACLGLGTHRDLRVPPVLLARLRHPDAGVRSAANEALRHLCGVDHGSDPSAWEKWWADVGSSFEFPARDAAEEGEGPGAADGEDKGRTTDEAPAKDRRTHARFFGIELTGRRIAFVVDYSQSMWGKRRDKAQAELIAAVKGLPSDHTFAVVLFNEPVWWFGDGPLPARPQEKLDLERYLPTQKTRKYTNIHGALTRALGLLGSGPEAVDPPPGLDEIVLLSDGVPNRGKYKDTERLLRSVQEMNQGRAVIHTVSLGDEEHELLPRIAAENGGRFVSHPFKK